MVLHSAFFSNDSKVLYCTVLYKNGGERLMVSWLNGLVSCLGHHELPWAL